MSTPRVMVGVSGGVDSSVAAWRLVQQGEAVAGLFMQNWADDGSGDCRAEDDRRDAVAVCGLLGIPFHFRDFSSEYWQGVFEHFLAEYAAGRTPNPDVLCNREVKFKHFLDAARELGAERIATGHYARVTQRGHQWLLLRGADRSRTRATSCTSWARSSWRPPCSRSATWKRATCAGSRATLACRHTPRRIPPASVSSVSAISASSGRYLPAKPGQILDPADGSVIAEHPGVFYFTLGQREGLNIGGVRGRPAAPWYVVGKDVASNVLCVDQDRDSPWMLSGRLRSERAHWIAGAPPARECTAQTRYRQPDEPCTVQVLDDGSVLVTFARPQRRYPGQSLVLYDGDVCLGGAVIAATDAPLEERLRTTPPLLR